MEKVKKRALHSLSPSSKGKKAIGLNKELELSPEAPLTLTR